MKVSRSLVALLPAALVLLVSLLVLARGTAPGLGAPLACEEAQLVEGELRCGPELLGDLRELCGADRAVARVLEAGDAIDLGACVCAAEPSLASLGLGCDGDSVGRMAPDQLAALDQVVDVNEASAAELTSLPGIGPTIAARIVAARPYASLDELLGVRGIGPKRLAALRARALITRPR